MHRADLDKLIPAERIVGDDAEDTELLQRMLREATDYLRSFRADLPGLRRGRSRRGVSFSLPRANPGDQ
jgi:hypothetical protein